MEPLNFGAVNIPVPVGSMALQCYTLRVVDMQAMRVAVANSVQIQTEKIELNYIKQNQQDATLHNGIYYYKCSTCFRRFLRPSSGAQSSIHSIGYLSSFFCFLPLSWVRWNLVHSENPTVSSVYLPTPRWHHLKAHYFLTIHSADEHHMIYSFSNATSYSTFYAFFSSFRITFWPMCLANSKRQPCFYQP